MTEEAEERNLPVYVKNSKCKWLVITANLTFDGEFDGFEERNKKTFGWGFSILLWGLIRNHGIYMNNNDLFMPINVTMDEIE